METKYHNLTLDGSDIPVCVGDRQYAQDKLRDFWNLKEYASRILEDLLCEYANNIIITGCIGSQGAGHTLSWTAGRVKVPHNVKTPTDWSALPPPMTSHTIPITIDIPTMSNQDISGATTDGITVNYAKFSYNESGTSSRQRAKKAGTYDSEIIPTYTFTCNSTSPTSSEVAFATFISNGTTLTFTGQENRWNRNTEYDFVVRNANDWKYAIERTGANAYKIKDSYKSIYFKYLTGGYLISDVLSGGDTWGVIQTNNCSNIIFESGAFINVGDTASYWETNTDDCYQKNINLVGTGVTAVSVAQSFLLNANRVVFENCKTSNRLSNIDFSGFKGSATALHNYTSKYIGCSIYNLLSISTDLCGFSDCYNIDVAIIYSFGSTTGALVAFSNCNLAKNIQVKDLINSGAGDIYGASECSHFSNFIFEGFTSNGGHVFGVYSCENFSNFQLKTFTTTGTNINLQGIRNSNQISNFEIDGLIRNDAYSLIGVYGSGQITSGHVVNITNSGAGDALGISNSTQVTSCFAENISSGESAIGFFNCYRITSCEALSVSSTAGTAWGFYGCENVASCLANLISSSNAGVGAAGFNNCIRGLVGCRATNAANSGAGTAYGIYACKKVQQCSGVNNKTAMYNTSYADSGVANACADTSAGGYNSAT